MQNPKIPSATKKNRTPRTDGDATRLHIIEHAGQLGAQYGFDAVTSKMICQAALVNIAAVNYHFGSRDGLYRAILINIHQRIANLDFLSELAKAALPPAEKLATIMRIMLEHIGSDNWHFRFYIREALTANDIFIEMLAEHARPKVQIVWRILAQITGISETDPRLPMCFISVMAPCVMPLIAQPRAMATILGHNTLDKNKLIEHMTQFALTGLKTISKSPLPPESFKK